MKNTIFISVMMVILGVAFVVPSYSDDLTWTYNQLATKDLNQMNQLVKDALKKAKKDTTPNPDVLRDITRTIFMRSNRDRMIEKVYPDVRGVQEENEELETTFNALVTDSINQLKSDNNRPAVQVSHIILLENFMAEFKPELENEAWVKKLFTIIKDAKIEVTDKVRSERKLRLMEETKSPSEVASEVLAKMKKGTS